ncbi:MAG: phosphoglycerate kinase [Variovorax sp.]|nr:MAG: phosphoglycerate kinase [Variovorax sp.]
MSRLWLLRHALTDSAPGLCYGRTDVGVPAAATRAAALDVVHKIPEGTVVFSSPLRRCAELAHAIAALRPDLSTRIDPRLAEMDFGAWEGQRWSSIARTEFDAWTVNFADGLPGGDGESTRRFMQRIGAAYDGWRASGCDALWITHAGVMRAVQLLHSGVREVERADQWPSQPIGYGECQCIDIASD